MEKNDESCYQNLVGRLDFCCAKFECNTIKSHVISYLYLIRIPDP